MHKSVTCVLFALTLALMASAPLPASTFNFSDTGNGYAVSGSLIGTNNGNGSFTIVSGTGFYNSDPITLIPGAGANAAFYFDNTLFPGNDPMLDTGGLLFAFDGDSQLNIWGTGPGSYSAYTYDPGSGYILQDNASSFALAAAPEPGTWAMLAMGLALAGIGGWRRKARSKA
jgi:hypothetical protein